MIAISCVSEPFERNNVARAVHEKAKFDAIKAQFAEVHASPSNCVDSIFSIFLQAVIELRVILLLFSFVPLQSCRILQERKDLNAILPVRAIINKELSRR